MVFHRLVLEYGIFNVVDYPNKAAIYQIGISGVNSSYASKVEVSFDRSSKSISKSSATAWGTISVPLSYEYTFDGRYTFTYTYSSTNRGMNQGGKAYVAGNSRPLNYEVRVKSRETSGKTMQNRSFGGKSTLHLQAHHDRISIRGIMHHNALGGWITCHSTKNWSTM